MLTQVKPHFVSGRVQMQRKQCGLTWAAAAAEKISGSADIDHESVTRRCISYQFLILWNGSMGSSSLLYSVHCGYPAQSYSRPSTRTPAGSSAVTTTM